MAAPNLPRRGGGVELADTAPFPPPTRTPEPPSSSAPASQPAPATGWRGLRWLARLLRGYLLATLLPLGLVLTLTPAPAEALAGYRLEILDARQHGSELEGLAGWTLSMTVWATGQAAERQQDLLQTSPLDTRLLTPTAQALDTWLQTHRGMVIAALAAAVAVLVFYGLLRRPSRRWWQPTVAGILTASIAMNFPAPILHAANLPGLTVTRQTTASAGGHLLNLGADRAEQVQAGAAERFWTGMVTGTHSRLQTRSSILTHTPAANRGRVVAFLHTQGVKQATGVQRAAITTSGLAAAAPFAAGIAAASLAGSTVQTLLLVLVLVLLLAGPVLAAAGRGRVLLLWVVLPALACLPLIGTAMVVSLGLTGLGAVAAAVWETVTSLVTGSVFALAILLVLGLWVRRRVRAWQQRRQAPPTARNASAAAPAAAAAAGRERKAGVA